MEWMGWKGLNLLMMTKAAVMGGNKRTDHAILAAALQLTTLRTNKQLCRVKNIVFVIVALI